MNSWTVSARAWRKYFSLKVTRILDEKKLTLCNNYIGKGTLEMFLQPPGFKNEESNVSQALCKIFLKNCKTKLDSISPPFSQYRCVTGWGTLSQNFSLRFLFLRRGRTLESPSLTVVDFSETRVAYCWHSHMLMVPLTSMFFLRVPPG